MFVPFASTPERRSQQDGGPAAQREQFMEVPCSESEHNRIYSKKQEDWKKQGYEWVKCAAVTFHWPLMVWLKSEVKRLEIRFEQEFTKKQAVLKESLAL